MPDGPLRPADPDNLGEALAEATAPMVRTSTVSFAIEDGQKVQLHPSNQTETDSGTLALADAA
jgi:hypothetical protein